MSIKQRFKNWVKNLISPKGDVIEEWVYDIDQKKIKTPPPHPTQSVLEPPKGWMVLEAGQNPLFMLWFVVIANKNDIVNNVKKPRIYVSEENDTYMIGLKNCINQIN